MDSLLNFSTLKAFALAAVAVAFVRVVSSKKRGVKYPPGPRPLPLIGNLLDFPDFKKEPWLLYTEWKKTYGDIIYLDLPGMPVIILNNYDDCVNLFDKRANIYNDRRDLYVSMERMGWGNGIMFTQYGERWRRFRRLVASAMKKEAVKQFHPIQERGIDQFLQTLLDNPEEYKNNFRFAAGKILLWTLYGREISDPHHPLIVKTEEMMQHILYALQPGNFLVDLIPWLKHIPEWLPGANFQKFARRGHDLTWGMIDTTFNQTVTDLKEGKPNNSFTAINLGKGETEDIAKWCSGSLFAAGVDTSVATFSIVINTLMRFPECQKRAQEEIDTVVGNGRLPNMDDRDLLPYTNALLKEIWRWEPSVPFALPHCINQDDVYNDMFIPAGSFILPNTWAIARDPNLFEKPDEFIPERYLPQEGKELPLDPFKFAFGYGRRVCAGIHYADTFAWLVMCRILASFDITLPLDADGNELPAETKYTSLTVREPVPFKCTIKPRSQTAIDLINAGASEDSQL